MKWWKWHEGLEFTGRKVTQDKQAADDYGLEYIESAKGKGLSSIPGLIHQGSNSGYQAVNLAYLEGAKTIILLGFDMKSRGDKAHWFGDHPDKLRSTYEQFRDCYRTIADQNPPVEIINCTRDTALRVFPCRHLEEVI